MTFARAAAARNIRIVTVQLHKNVLKYRRALALRCYFEEEHMMELADIRNELDKSASKLADFRGSL
ncbi:ribosomal protein S24E [Planomicrobium stackebrandtii]|uniref:Ribosomal protein S24E n=1 Tax=Planomicrobium stackebrandtii TaxID=253160 RepID=A0ABU0GWV5_9BACL|nr:ribosomal protein S24E [Planomicrobium stackebrandtii]